MKNTFCNLGKRVYTPHEEKVFCMKRKVLRGLLFSALLFSPWKALGDTNLTRMEAKEETADNDIPTIEEGESDKTVSSLSTAVNRFFSAKQIQMDSLNVTINLDGADPTNVLCLKLSNLDLDLGNLNTLSFNFYSQLNIEYKGFTTQLDVEYRADDYLYISHKKGNTFKCSIPLTINELINTLKAIGVSINSTGDIGDVSLLDIITFLKSAKSTEEKSYSSDSTLAYSLSFDDLGISNKKISNLKLLLLSDADENPKGFRTINPIEISDVSDASKKISIAIDSKVKNVYSTSRYQSHSSDSTDITSTSSSLLGLVSDIFSGKYSSSGEKRNQFSVNLSGSISNKVNDSLTTTSYLKGSLQADITDVLDDENIGEYSLSLTQNENDFFTGKSLNDIDVYFKKEVTYLSLNDIFKGKIENSKLSDVFSTISELTELFAIKEIDKNLNIVLSVAKEGNIEKLRNGDYSLLNNVVKNYQFSDSYFSITIDTSSLGLESSDVTLSVHFNEKDDGTYEVKDIEIDKIQLGNITLNDFSVSITSFDGITKPDDADYDSYTESLSLFDTLADIVDEKKISADYSLVFTDQQNVTFNAEGKISADISNATIVKDNETKTLYTDSGNYYLSLKLPQEKNDKDTILGQGIEMFYSGTDKNLYFGCQYDQNDNFTELKDSSYYVFRNSITNADIKSMYSLIDSKVESKSSNTSGSILSMSTMLSTIKESEAFSKLKEDITNNLSLKGLDGVLSTSVDEENNIVVTLDPGTFLTGSKYETNTSTLSFTLGTNNEIVSLSMSGRINGCGISFSVALNDNVISYDRFNENDYPRITSAEALLESFISLPTDLSQFDLGISGQVQKEGDDIPSLQISEGSGVSADLSDEKKSVSGIVSLKHKDINDASKLISSDQKIEFNYQQLDGTTTNSSGKEVGKSQFMLEYNDNMHVKMENSTLYSIMDTINGVDSDSNLLFRYLKFLNSSVMSSGSPLMDVLNGKALSTSGIFAKPYLRSLTFSEGSMELKVDPKLVKSDALDGSECSIIISYDINEKKITSAGINAKYISGTTENPTTTNISVSLSLSPSTEKKYARSETTDTSLTATDNNILSYVDGTTSSCFVDVDGLSVLLKCAVDTTENNFMEIQGELSINVSLVNKTVNAKAYAAVYVENETAYAYIRINAFGLSISDENYRVTEYFIKEKDVYVNQTKTSKSSSGLFSKKYKYTTSADYYRTTSENVTKNIAYYILDYSMDLGRVTVLGASAGKLALNQIYNAMNSDSSDASISNDFSKVLSGGTIYDEANHKFTLSLNLKDFLSISPASIESLTITLTHEEETSVNGKSYKPLKSVAIDGKLSVLSILNITITSSSTLNTFTMTDLRKIDASQAKSTYMKRYFQFMDLISDETFDIYEITSITEAGSPNTTGSYKTTKLESSESSSSSYPFTDEQITANGFIYRW